MMPLIHVVKEVVKKRSPKDVRYVFEAGLRTELRDGEEIWRVVEGIGASQQYAGGDKRPSDGGGFLRESDALALASQLNARRG